AIPASVPSDRVTQGGGAEQGPHGRKFREAPSQLELHHLLLLLAEPGNAETHDVAGLEELRRLHAEADAGRRAGDDDVAGLHDEELRAVPHDMGHAEDHGPGRTLLARLAVDRE